MMGQSQMFEFQALLKRVASVFRVRTDNEEFRGISSSYFRALQRHELADLERGADAWIGRESKFPKPAEWAQAIPGREVTFDTMTDAEAREWAREESLKWEDTPCPCASCVAAGIWQPRRFVPEFTVDDQDRKVRDPLRNRIVTAGHWAHGAELQGYYRAKGAFYARCIELGLEPGRVLKEPRDRRRKKAELTLVGSTLDV